jgi:DNA-binding NarL/FixJ family response regulator
VEDHPMMREGLRVTIGREPDLMVCGEVGTAQEALSAVTRLKPDLVLTDITLPGRSGLEFIKDLAALHPELPALVISMHDESLYAERVIRAGAKGYLTKNQSPADLVHAIREVLGGRLSLSAPASENIVRRISGQRLSTPAAVLDVLTDREFEIFQLAGQGRTQLEMARELHLSPKTVAVHAGNIRKKLKLKSQPDLIRFSACFGEPGNKRRI